MSGNFHDANYNVTKIRTEAGDVAELELNGKAVDLTGESKLVNNRTVTIDVSQYTEPVVINPEVAGKVGMKKATVTLDNIPVPTTTVKLYAWKAHRPGETNPFYIYTSFPATDEPYIMSTSDLFLNVFDSQSLFAPSTDLSTKVQLSSFNAYASGITYGKPTLTISSKTQFQLRYVTSGSHTDYTFVRDSSKDFTVWPSIFQS